MGKTAPITGVSEPGEHSAVSAEIVNKNLTAGMILQGEIRTKVGVLLVGKGQEITYPLSVRLRNYYLRRAIPEEVLVLVPAATT